MPCKSTMSCSLIKNSVCSKNKICICDHNKLAVNKLMCKPMINEFCLKDEHCSVEDLRCLYNTCQCQTNYSPASDSQCIESWYSDQIIKNNIILVPKFFNDEYFFIIYLSIYVTQLS